MTDGILGRKLVVTTLPLAGLYLVKRSPKGDQRGFLERIFCQDELRDAGWTGPVAQVNRTWTARRGTVRGLHFQHPPAAEMKLVVCLRGDAFDVAVDLRDGSDTRGSWHAERLSAQNHNALLIPQGFAHGFQALSDDVELLYLHSVPYAPTLEDGVHPEDPALAVAWPLPVQGLSRRDAERPFMDALPRVRP
jgi:dTDP-4-dehydrorhamnose 3,5-epimerase